MFDRSITRLSCSSLLSTDLESLKLPLRFKEPPNDLLFVVFLSRSWLEPTLKMTPRFSAIWLMEHREFMEFRDSREPFITTEEIEQVDFRNDLVERDELSIKVIGNQEVIGSNFKAR